jgi:DNA-binding NtrC family response regulator
MPEIKNYSFKDDFLSMVQEGGKLKILLLEDLASDAALVQLQLRKIEKEKEVKHVVNQDQFEEALISYRPHLVLSDYSLGQYTGMEALIHAKNTNQNLPFIICTGSINEATAVSCIKAGLMIMCSKTHSAG